MGLYLLGPHSFRESSPFSPLGLHDPVRGSQLRELQQRISRTGRRPGLAVCPRSSDRLRGPLTAGQRQGKSGGDDGLPRPQLGVDSLYRRHGVHALRDAPRPWKVRSRRRSCQRKPRARSINPAGIGRRRRRGPFEREPAGPPGAPSRQRPGRGCATGKTSARRLLLTVEVHQSRARTVLLSGAEPGSFTSQACPSNPESPPPLLSRPGRRLPTVVPPALQRPAVVEAQHRVTAALHKGELLA